MATNQIDNTVIGGGFFNSGAVTGSISSPVTAAGITGLGSGTVGSTLTSTGAGTAWTAATHSISNGAAISATGKMELHGKDADLVIAGESIKDRFKNIDESLTAIQERLNILRPNKDLEKDWAELAELGRLYREKEAYILEGLKIWDILNE